MVTKTRPSRKTATKLPSTEDESQYERFRKFAREVEADDDPEEFDRKFRKIVPPKPSQE